MIHGLSASTFRPAFRAARMRSILPRLRPVNTTMLPAGERSISALGSLPVWTSSVQQVRSQRCVDGDAGIHPGVHVFLHEGGVKMPRIDDDQFGLHGSGLGG